MCKKTGLGKDAARSNANTGTSAYCKGLRPGAAALRRICMLCLQLQIFLLTVAVALAGRAVAVEPGVGRLNFGGYKVTTNCTAFLTGPGHLITAAHCLQLSDDARLHFLQEYDRGLWAGHSEILVDWFFQDEVRDLAVVCRATDPTGRALIVSGEPLELGESLEVWGYGAPRSHRLQRIACPLVGFAGDDTLVLGCSVSGGTSGAPVVRLRERQREVVGVIRGTDGDNSYAAHIEPRYLQERCRQ